MERNYFDSLDAVTRTELAWNYGELVVCFELSRNYVSLYVLSDFFVEVHVNKFSEELEYIQIQDDRDILAAYLCRLNLGPLLKLSQ